MHSSRFEPIREFRASCLTVRASQALSFPYLNPELFSPIQEQVIRLHETRGSAIQPARDLVPLHLAALCSPSHGRGGMAGFGMEGPVNHADCPHLTKLEWMMKCTRAARSRLE